MRSLIGLLFSLTTIGRVVDRDRPMVDRVTTASAPIALDAAAIVPLRVASPVVTVATGSLAALS